MKIIKFSTIKFSLVFLLLCFNSNAAEIKFSHADNKNGLFSIKVFSVINANPQKVFDILTDYNHITRLSPKIIESKLIRTEGELAVVKTIAKGCVWFFCKKIINTQTITIKGTTINAATLPKESNLKVGKMMWKITPASKGTNIEYYAEIKPDFFVPPVIGAFFIKKSLLEEASYLFASIEKIANETVAK